MSLPETSSPVGELRHCEAHKDMSAARDKLEKKEGQVADMSTVYYKQSYEDATRKVRTCSYLIAQDFILLYSQYHGLYINN